MHPIGSERERQSVGVEGNDHGRHRSVDPPKEPLVGIGAKPRRGILRGGLEIDRLSKNPGEELIVVPVLVWATPGTLYR